MEKQEDALGPAEAAAVEAHALARAGVEHEQPQLGSRLEVVGDGIAGRRLHSEAQQLRIDWLDEARRSGEQRGPDAPAAVEGRRDGEALPGKEAAGTLRQAPRDDPPGGLRLVEAARATLHLPLAGVEWSVHGLGMPLTLEV